MKSNKKEHQVSYKLTPDAGQRKEITWYPGHMAKAMKQIGERLKKVDLVIEMRDARLPGLSGNPELKKLLGQKKRLILFSKSDLTTKEHINHWKKKLGDLDINFLFITNKDQKDKAIILSKLKEIIAKEKIRIMICGIPNCGKSTLINTMAGKNSTRVANKPGHTTAQQWVKISDEVELLDTPGVMPPKIENYKHGLKLACIHAISDKIIPKDELCLFMVNHLLKKSPHIFQEKYDLSSNAQSAHELLDLICQRRGALLKQGDFDYERIYNVIISDFRSGFLGPISL